MQQSWYEALSKQFVGYPTWAVELGIFGVVFLIIGFLARSFGRLFFVALLAIAVALGAAYYFNLAPAFLTQLKDFFGLHDVTVLGDLPAQLITWARTHVVGCAGVVLGFFVGYSIG